MFDAILTDSEAVVKGSILMTKPIHTESKVVAEGIILITLNIR